MVCHHADQVQMHAKVCYISTIMKNISFMMHMLMILTDYLNYICNHDI